MNAILQIRDGIAAAAVTGSGRSRSMTPRMRRDPPDVVTLDVMIRKVDGRSVLGIVKSEPELTHIPVIMLTIGDDRNLGFSLGAAQCMTKPIDRRRLTALVRKFAATDPGGTVLVVDDERDVRALLARAIEEVGMHAAAAVRGQAALDWLREHRRPSLVLLDPMMPMMDGFSLRSGSAPMRRTPTCRWSCSPRRNSPSPSAASSSRIRCSSWRRDCNPSARSGRRSSPSPAAPPRGGLKRDHAVDPDRRRQRDEPRYAVASSGAQRFRRGDRRRRAAGCRSRRVRAPRPHPHGHEPSGYSARSSAKEAAVRARSAKRGRWNRGD